MYVINIHRRRIHQRKQSVSELLDTLASDEDKILATDKWSPMILDRGLSEGSKGGHGPIRYTVQKYHPGEFIEFKFTKPTGFIGSHRFEINELTHHQTEIKHTIEMYTKGIGVITWAIAIRWLHDAFIEDAFDKVENTFSKQKKKTQWSIWVKILRWILKPRKNR